MTDIKPGCSLVWWKLSKLFDPHLAHDLRDLAFKVPAAQGSTPKECLRYALHAVKEKDTVIRSLQGGNGYGVFAEIKGAKTNQYPLIYSASIDEHYHVEFESPHGDLNCFQKINELVQFAKDKLQAKSVSSMLVDVVHQLEGVRASDGGGFYVLQNEKIDMWNRACALARKHALDSFSSYRIDYELNEESMEAVASQLASEIHLEAERIKAEFASESFTERKQSNRLGETERMLVKVEKFEKLFNRGLTSCREGIADILDVLAVDSAADSSNDPVADLMMAE